MGTFGPGSAVVSALVRDEKVNVCSIAFTSFCLLTSSTMRRTNPPHTSAGIKSQWYVFHIWRLYLCTWMNCGAVFYSNFHWFKVTAVKWVGTTWLWRSSQSSHTQNMSAWADIITRTISWAGICWGSSQLYGESNLQRLPLPPQPLLLEGLLRKLENSWRHVGPLRRTP